jgi:hypothetical protein
VIENLDAQERAPGDQPTVLVAGDRPLEKSVKLSVHRSCPGVRSQEVARPLTWRWPAVSGAAFPILSLGDLARYEGDRGLARLESRTPMRFRCFLCFAGLWVEHPDGPEKDAVRLAPNSDAPVVRAFVARLEEKPPAGSVLLAHPKCIEEYRDATEFCPKCLKPIGKNDGVAWRDGEAPIHTGCFPVAEL